MRHLRLVTGFADSGLALKRQDRPEQQSTTPPFAEVQKEVRYGFVSINQGFSPYAPLYSVPAPLPSHAGRSKTQDALRPSHSRSLCPCLALRRLCLCFSSPPPVLRLSTPALQRRQASTLSESPSYGGRRRLLQGASAPSRHELRQELQVQPRRCAARTVLPTLWEPAPDPSAWQQKRAKGQSSIKQVDMTCGICGITCHLREYKAPKPQSLGPLCASPKHARYEGGT